MKCASVGRGRHERLRNRTRERALLALQQVVEVASLALPPPGRRVPLCFAVAFPLEMALRKELGEELVALGLIGRF